MPQQLDWRFCIKRSTMFFNGSANKGTCPAGGGHNGEGFIFALPFDVPETGTGQAHWRFCSKCFAMFFTEGGRCPAGGGTTPKA